MNAKILFTRPSIALSLTLLMITASALLALAVPTAQATQTLPLYAWGANDRGQLGLGVAGAHLNTPQRVGVAENWVDSAAAANASLAISSQGHLYVWGHNWTFATMGQGEHPNPGTGNITVPTRIGTANNWSKVFARGSDVAAITTAGHLYTWGTATNPGRPGPNDVPIRVGNRADWKTVALGSGAFFAITEGGELWAWGSGTLGFTPITNRSTPQRVDNRTDWVSVATTGAHTIALTEGGALYGWGSNSAGQLGLGDTITRATPQRIGAASNWADVAVSSSATAAINSNGELFTWGTATNGRLGNGTTSGDVLVPTQIASQVGWSNVMGGGNHFLAFTTGGALYGWGTNTQGQLGVGDFGHRSVPTFVAQTNGRAETPRGGGLHSMLLVRIVPAEAGTPLEKRLQLPEGTPIPTTAFTFTFERNSHNDIEANYHFLPVIPNRVINITPTSPATTAGGITTVTVSTDALAGIEFARPGAFSYIVREVQSAPGIGANSTLTFSPAVYELRIYIVTCSTTGDFEFYAKTLTPLTVDNNTQTVGTKTADLVFTNTYTRTTTGANGALFVSKYMDGPFANPSQLFDFEITLSAAALSGDTNFVGRVYNANGAFSGRSYTFTSGVERVIQLGHGQRLVFNTLTVGTGFTVTERAIQEFRASVVLYVNGTQVNVAPNANPNTALPIGNHLVGVGANSAEFTNVHDFVTPTGLSVTNNLPSPVFLIAAVALTLLIVSKRKKILEELLVV